MDNRTTLLEEIPEASPNKGDVLVRVAAAGALDKNGKIVLQLLDQNRCSKPFTASGQPARTDPV